MESQRLSAAVVVGSCGAVAVGVALGVGLTKLAGLVSARRAHSQLCQGLKLYHQKIMQSSRVRWAVDELGLSEDCEIISYNPYNASPEEKEKYQANVHPNGLIPALQLPGGQVMFEGPAICFYLAQSCQELLPPSDALNDYYSWSLYAAYTLEPSIHTLYVQAFIVDAKQQDMALQDIATTRVTSGLARLGKHLEDREYICGDRVTMADIIVGYTLMFASTIEGGKLLANQLNVKEYLETLKMRPCFLPSMGTVREWVQGASQ